jgi:Enoyl-[acyl-carrier-protein] reductase (NADH)
MGLAKASLESSVRYIAHSLGNKNIRVNAISAGPIKTLAASGISGFSEILKHVENKAPLKRNITQEEIANAALFLLNNQSSGITGQVIYVDCGYSIVGF